MQRKNLRRQVRRFWVIRLPQAFIVSTLQRCANAHRSSSPQRLLLATFSVVLLSFCANEPWRFCSQSTYSVQPPLLRCSLGTTYVGTNKKNCTKQKLARSFQDFFHSQSLHQSKKATNAALERLAHATTDKGYSPASPLQALMRGVA